MPLLFLLFFVAIPATELYIMIEVGSEIGAFATIWLVLLTAVVGGWLVRQQGISTLFRMHTQLAQGEAPAFDMLQGILLALAGVSLLLPGFVSDTIGFLLLIPPLRHYLVLRWLQKRRIMTPAGDADTVTIVHREVRHYRDGEVIEGEFTHKPASDNDRNDLQ